MKNKKWMLILLALVMVMALAACGNNEEEAQEPEAEPPVQEEPVQEAEEDEKEMIMDEFRTIVEEGEASVNNIKQFMDENLPVLGELEGNHMLDNLENALKKELDVVNKNIAEFDAEEELMELIGGD
jgi:ABC-type Fe3+-hydroxamate transport system substrate-binding protein